MKHRIPLTTSNAAWAPAGAFMSYGADLRDAARKVAAYAERILNGGKPADLPVQLPTHFELIINQKTARAIGLNVPQSVLVRADYVIR